MDGSREANPRSARMRQISMSVPSRFLLMIIGQASASMRASKRDTNRPSRFAAIGSGWPTKCHCRGMKTRSSTSRSALIHWQFTAGRTMLPSKR